MEVVPINSAFYDECERLWYQFCGFPSKDLLWRRRQRVLTEKRPPYLKNFQPQNDTKTYMKSLICTWIHLGGKAEALKSCLESAGRPISIEVLASLIVMPPMYFGKNDLNNLKRVFRTVISGASDPEEAVSKNLFEMKTKVEAIRDSLQRQDASELEVEECEDVIKFIEEELRYLEAECSKLYLQALIAWIIVITVENSDCDSLRTLSVSLLASQTIEVILVASGDVERNPGPTYLDGMFVFAAPPKYNFV